MAGARTYRHDLRCPHCGSNWLPKAGLPRGKQTYRCGDCAYRFTPDGNRSYHSAQTMDRAMAMYTEGSSIAAISRVMDVKAVTVASWVKKGGPAHEDTGYGAG